MKKVRLDILLAERGLAESRNQAQRLVMAGEVRVDGQIQYKPSVEVAPDVVLELKTPPQFVSRGGEKLQGALQTFDMMNLHDMVCVDIGASTGGFTDCLLQHGAARVYAVDVGYGQIHWKLRNDPRVIVMERTNARNISAFPDRIDLVTVDASFISLKILLPVIRTWFTGQGLCVALIKPQFEAGRADAARGEGVIRSPEVHRQVLENILHFAVQEGYGVTHLVRSSLVGPKGNVEFLTRLIFPGLEQSDLTILVSRLFI